MNGLCRAPDTCRCPRRRVWTVTESANRRKKIVDVARVLAGEAMDEVGGRLASDWIEYGYDQASSLSTGLIGKRIDDLNEKVRSGGELTVQEQYLLIILGDVKSEIERELQYNWERFVRP